jgi:hypothetical protein
MSAGGWPTIPILQFGQESGAIAVYHETSIIHVSNRVYCFKRELRRSSVETVARSRSRAVFFRTPLCRGLRTGSRFAEALEGLEEDKTVLRD